MKKDYDKMAKKLTEITEEEVNSVKLPFKRQLVVFLKAIPLITITVLLSLWEYFIVLIKIPGDIVEMLTLEEVLIELTKDK